MIFTQTSGNLRCRSSAARAGARLRKMLPFSIVDMDLDSLPKATVKQRQLLAKRGREGAETSMPVLFTALLTKLSHFPADEGMDQGQEGSSGGVPSTMKETRGMVKKCSHPNPSSARF